MDLFEQRALQAYFFSVDAFVYSQFLWIVLWPRLLNGMIFILRRGDVVSSLLETYTYTFCKIRIRYVNHGLAIQKPELRSSLDAVHSSGIRPAAVVRG
jgi:hypothetical protein